MNFAFLVAAFVATVNGPRVRLAHPERGLFLPALGALGLAAAAIAFAEELLEALAISPESFRIAAGLVLAVAGLRTLVRPVPGRAPALAAAFTPELAVLAVSAGADDATGRAVAAAAVGVVLVLAPVRAVPAARFLAALQVVVAVALVVGGIRDV